MQSIYPSPPKTVNLKSLKKLEKFKATVGFSDHTQNNDACLAAVSLGAKIIEKHFTIDKKLKVPDQIISADPVQFKNLVNSIRNIEKLLGGEDVFPSHPEIKKRKINHRSIISTKFIKKGDKFDHNNISLMRSNGKKMGLDPKFYFQILGKKSKRNISKETKINKNHF